jgi:predicted nucleic acid-binding protein
LTTKVTKRSRPKTLSARCSISSSAERIDPDTDRSAWTGALRLADRFRLTLYDASYLELAQRRALPLASVDVALYDAARALGVEISPCA